jgi:hypothetical protein
MRHRLRLLNNIWLQWVALLGSVCVMFGCIKKAANSTHYPNFDLEVEVASDTLIYVDSEGMAEIPAKLSWDEWEILVSTTHFESGDLTTRFPTLVGTDNNGLLLCEDERSQVFIYGEGEYYLAEETNRSAIRGEVKIYLARGSRVESPFGYMQKKME